MIKKIKTFLKKIFCSHSHSCVETEYYQYFEPNYFYHIIRKCSDCGKYLPLTHIEHGAMNQMYNNYIDYQLKNGKNN